MAISNIDMHIQITLEFIVSLLEDVSAPAPFSDLPQAKARQCRDRSIGKRNPSLVGRWAL